VFIFCKISRFLYSARLAWNSLFISRPLWGSFSGILPPNEFRYWRNSKRAVLRRKHVVRAINRENPSTGSTWARAREKKYSITNQLTRKKSQNRNISPIWREAPAERIEMKIFTGVDLGDVIMSVKFKFEKKLGILMSLGQNSPFPIDFARGPYNSAALPRCLWLTTFMGSTDPWSVDSQNDVRLQLRSAPTCVAHSWGASGGAL